MKPPRVIFREIKQKKNQLVYGKYYPATGTVIVDPRQDDDDKMDTLIHETLHHCETHYGISMEEDKVNEVAGVIAGVLWDAGYRRVNP